MTGDTPHGAAAALADLGWSVLPIHSPDLSQPAGCSCGNDECNSPGKHPRTPNGLHDATRDCEVISAWWKRWPDASLGVATGTPSGIWVLDLDGPGAVDKFLDLQNEHGRLSPTVTSRTGRGFHIFFTMPTDGDVRNSAGKVAEGIDVRGTGGYIVAPPSPHPSGRFYGWATGRGPDELVLVAAPSWLLKRVRREPETFSAPFDPPDMHGSRYVEAAIRAECDELAQTPKGRRNEALNRAAFALARFVATGEASAPDIARQLAYAAARAGLSETEIRKTVLSAFLARGVAA